MSSEIILQKGLAIYSEPTPAQLKLIYTNPDHCNQLTHAAIICCQNIGIDYRDLLPRQDDNRLISSSLSNAQREVKDRQHEIRRKRRIIQIAKMLQ